MTRGFTLIELLVVVLVIGILAAVALPQYQTAVERARATEALTQMRALQDSLERYHSQHEAWPTGTGTNAQQIKFNKLDVDIPIITPDPEEGGETYYGGKHFSLDFTINNGNPSTVTITATRLRQNNSYTLQTRITPRTNGTYTAVRTCSGGTSEEANSYCNAIAGGADKASQGF